MTRTTSRKTLLAAGLISLALAGCQTGAPAGVGTAGGAVLGGLVGSAFGSGSGAVAATIGGALLGGYIGNQTIDRRRYENYRTRYRGRYY